MQKHSFLLLLTATIVAVAAAGYTLAKSDRAVSPVPREALAFSGLAAHLGDLAWMRLAHGAQTMDFAAIAGEWAVVGKGNYPASPDRIHRLLFGLADLALVEPKTRRRALFGRLGLDDPPAAKSTLVSLQDRTGKTLAALLIGQTHPDLVGGGSDGVYVRKASEDQAWLARGSLDLSGDVTDWLDRRILDIAESRIQSMTLTGADGATLVLRRDEPGGPFALTDPPAGAQFKDQAARAAPAAALRALQLDDVKTAAELPAPATGIATAAFATFDGLTIKLRLFAVGKADWVALDASGTGKAAREAAALDARVARWVYAIPAERAKLLRTRLADLLAPPKGS
jgi:Domain of unknown function (DUF4340)